MHCNGALLGVMNVLETSPVKEAPAVKESPKDNIFILLYNKGTCELKVSLIIVDSDNIKA